MPIIAIEGPDKCGKSTLFEQLRDSGLLAAKYVHLPSFSKRRMHIASELALRDLELWEALYNPRQLYICDRHVIISDAVYSKLYGRSTLRNSVLAPHLGVLYIDIVIEELVHRHSVCCEDVQKVDTYPRVKELYTEVLKHFVCRRITAQHRLRDTVIEIQELVHDIS